MITVDQFKSAIAQAISEYPVAAQLYKVGDPRLLAQLNAMAVMLAMRSAEQDVTASEPFIKARDATVLADAAVKGVLPYAISQQVRLLVQNNYDLPLVIANGRTLLDSQGRQYMVNAGLTIPNTLTSLGTLSIPPGSPAANTAYTVGTAPTGAWTNFTVGDYAYWDGTEWQDAGVDGAIQMWVSAIQQSTTTTSYTIPASQPFLPLQLPTPASGQYLTGISVQQQLSGDVQQPFTYFPDFCNAPVYDSTIGPPTGCIYNIEADELQNLYVRFGATGLAGYQPNPGDVFNVTMNTCEGSYSINAGTPFTFQYVSTPQETAAVITLVEVLEPGAMPITIDALREIAKYPSIYDSNAVYLGNFAFLIRRAFPNLRFLSVWNEQTEEAARGPSLDNINTIFVAVEQDGTDQTTLQNQIQTIIQNADDSYNVTFVAVSEVYQPITIDVEVPAVYDFGDVENQIAELVLENYGRDSEWAKTGQSVIIKKALGALMEENIQAIAETVSDYSITVGTPGSLYPETYLYVAAPSLTINVTQAES